MINADAIFVGEVTDDRAGAALDEAGDPNSDGYADILIGAYGSDRVHSDAGAAYLFSAS